MLGILIGILVIVFNMWVSVKVYEVNVLPLYQIYGLLMFLIGMGVAVLVSII